ncbi:hypothetical protein PseudUWO311_23380 [Pseudanabaena sp. UWO311]|nr:hypothetical protein PseudUWO311_23380 [Pseudanabaena sp. UWO311]
MSSVAKSLTDECTGSKLAIDTILKSRWQGAVNIRGIRFQILYSLLRAFDLYDVADGERYVRLEGIEDIDLLGFFSENEYIQVKTSDKPWYWSQLGDPIKNFLEVSRSANSAHFTLVVNFIPKTDIEKLYQLSSLSTKDREDITKKFHTLCNKEGGSTEESTNLLQRLRLLPISEKQIWEQLELKLLEAFNLGGEGISTYLSVLIARFLDWAKERKTIGRRDLENIRVEIGEALSREQEFEAYGRGYIERLIWKEDSTPNDFLEGKGTRAGHIIADLDIPRKTWLDRIDQAFSTSKVCILKSSSGQGKSTLLYRYAAERWQRDNVFAIRAVESPEQASQICSYLQVRVSLGLPILLLIDGISYQTRYWSTVVRECSAIGIRVLISVRDEDWYRFGNSSSVSYEIIKPDLALPEARQIFQFLKSRDRLHSSATSAEGAYEKVGSHLLMEYVYLLTQGHMLEERLKEQIMQFSQYQENTAKIEILSRVVLADALGSPLLLSKFFDQLNIDGDRQQILLSLQGEYLKIQDNKLTGLHWIRSACLVRILHEGYPNPASTAISVLNAVPKENLSSFITNAICMEGFGVDEFISELAEQAGDVDIETIILYLESIFEAGEQSFFTANRSLFDDAYNAIGKAAPFMLSTEFIPTIKLDTISSMIASFGDRAGGFKILQDISLKAIKVPRGLDLCQQFLKKASINLKPEQFKSSIKHIGKLLDWCFWCHVELPIWSVINLDIINIDSLLSSSVEEFCIFMQGFSRYDKAEYEQWISVHNNRIIDFLKGKTETLNLEVSSEKLYLEFIVNPEEASPVGQAMLRLEYCHAAFPYCDSYQSKGIWLLPSGLIPSVDYTQQNKSREDFHFESDASKNAVWVKIVRRAYFPDSCFSFEKAWYECRTYSLGFVRNLSVILKELLTRGKLKSKDDSLDFLIAKLETSIKFLPLSLSKVAEVKEVIEGFLGSILNELEAMKENPLSNWSQSLSDFLYQFRQYLINQDSAIGNLAVRKFKDASQHLTKMHDLFALIFQESPDYFDARNLNSQEMNCYPILCDLLEVWIVDRPKILPLDIMKYIQSQKEFKWQETLEKIKTALAPLLYRIDFILPSGIYIDYPQNYLPLAFSVADPCNPEKELLLILNALNQAKHITEYFCLVPIFQGKRFLKGGFQIKDDDISTIGRDEKLAWEVLETQEFSEQIWKYLPEILFEENPHRLFKSTIDTLVVGIDQLFSRIALIQPLSNSTDSPIDDFYNRQQGKAISLMQTIEDAANISLWLLDELFQSYRSTQEYTIIHEFLQNINTDMLRSFYDFEKINNAVKELLKPKMD